jgi:hypothetical protein
MDGTTPQAAGTRPDLTVEQVRTLAPEVAAELRRIYLAAFEPMKTRSFTRIVMTDDEWQAMIVQNEHTVKHVGWVDGVLAGVLVATNRPDLVDWISIDFLRARYPEALDGGRLWYIMTVAVEPAVARSGLLRRLVEDFIGTADWEVVIYDTCEVNAFIDPMVVKAMSTFGIERPPDVRPLDIETAYAWMNTRT